MPSNRKERALLLEAIPKEIDGPIYELGAGFGHLAFPLACRYPHLPIVAFELSPFPYLILKIGALRYKNLEVRRKNFYRVNLEGASLCLCYLYRGAMQKLEKKFSSELQPGAYILSNTFSLPGWKPEKVWEFKIFLYRKPPQESCR